MIRGLNIALAEGHTIELPEAIKAELARHKDRTVGVAAVCHSKTWLKDRVKEQICRLLSTPAKPHTPKINAEPALIAQKGKKAAETAFLARECKIARRNYFAHHKRAIPPRKADFSVNSCC
ncbi:hypothetical protein ES703_116700 [subsurface metagenome]